MSTEFKYTEEVTGEIVQIPVGLLHHHHDNPRKDLGDLTELTDSIKAKGVLQNLTVVPYWFKITGKGCDDPKEQAEMGYLVVIGNRRLEAATFVKKNYDAVIAFLVQRRWTPNNYVRFDYEVYSDVIGAEIEDESDMSYDLVKEQTEANTFKALLAYAYAFCGDSESQTCKDWNNIYRENENLEKIYEFLASIGYEMSDEEKDLLDGTSELYEEYPDSEITFDDDDFETDDLSDEQSDDDSDEDDESDEDIVNALKEMYDDGEDE